MDERIKQYQEQINKGIFKTKSIIIKVLTVSLLEFINDFNEKVSKYGSYKVIEALSWIYMGKYTPKYIDFMYGWTKPISLENDFIVSVKGNNIICKLNLQEPQSFFEGR